MYRIIVQEKKDGEWTERKDLAIETDGFVTLAKKEGSVIANLQGVTDSDISLMLIHVPSLHPAILSSIPFLALARKMIDASKEIDAEQLLTQIPGQDDNGRA